MSLYQFTDTIAPAAATGLPSEAMQIDGEYIENQIDGYRTLYTRGRELIGSEIEEYNVGNTDGSYYRRNKLPPRNIVVGYQLIADTPEHFRDKFNKLNAILNVEQVKIIFADETDKYFVATRAEVDNVPEGTNKVVAEFTMHCSDPLKYSTATKTVSATLDSETGTLQAVINNEGTVPVPIDYEVTMNGNNGYIGIVSEKGTMQYGYAGEQEQTQSTFPIDISDPHAVLSSGTRNATYDSFYPDSYGVHTWAGTLAADQLSDGSVTKNAISLSSVGSGTKWRGSNVRLPINVESDNWVAKTRLCMDAANSSERFGLCFILLDSESKLVAAAEVYKNLTSITEGTAYLFIGQDDSYTNKRYVSKFAINLKGQAENPPGPFTLSKLKTGCGLIQISRHGDSIEFNIGGTTKTFTMPQISAPAYVLIGLTALSGSPFGARQILYNLGGLSFRRDNTPYINDVPNRYQSGDVLSIDGSSCRAYINGTPCLDDEIIGTEYFKAVPGDMKIQFPCSDWVTNQPTITATIREAWL